MYSGIRRPIGHPHTTRFFGSREYAVWLNGSGAGATQVGEILLTPFSGVGDQTLSGFRVFLRDRESGNFAVFGQKETFCAETESLKSQNSWQPGVFSLFQHLDGIEARLDVCVMPSATAELRRVTLCNRSDRPRELDLTTFAEVVLNRRDAHESHPAFSKLFLQTAFDADRSCLTVSRRPRDPQDSYPVLVHAALGGGTVECETVACETSRPDFLGRGRSTKKPAAMTTPDSLSGTTGNVLDPVVSLRRVCHLQPGEEQEFTFLLGTATDTAGAARLVDSLPAQADVANTFAAATAAAEKQLAAENRTADEDQYYQDLAGAVIGAACPTHPRAPGFNIIGEHRESLLRLGLSLQDDWVVVHAETPEGAQTEAVMILAAHRWAQWGLPIQLVVIQGEEAATVVKNGHVQNVLMIKAADLTPTEFQLLNSAARLLITESLPDFSAAFEAAPIAKPTVAPVDTSTRTEAEALTFFNGWGGFNTAGNEYVIRLKRDPDGHLALPPLPWCNVMANETFGCLVSESGAGSTWYQNSRENRLTPWTNDPVLDPHGDAFHVRDDETGAAWSCLPGPTPGPGDYEVRHGFGYTRFHHASNGLKIETTLFVARTDPVRITRITVTNASDRTRRLSLYGCCQLVLGGEIRPSGRFVNTWRDDQTGALLARNPASATCPQAVAFAAVVTESAAVAVHDSCHLATYVGAQGDFTAPAAFANETLDGQVATEMDSCFAHQARLELAPGESGTVSFLLGQEAGADWAREVVIRHGTPAAIETAWQNANAFWQEGLSGLQVETPSPALDLMVNGWLAYQTLSCRIHGRTALYQSGGAFGFRDQLQDSSSLIPLWPEKTRRQILLHAAHQFPEGDVMHWWHTPHGQGIRTRFADDLLWLPLLTAEYITTTGDQEILAEKTSYLTARLLEPGEDEVFLRPTQSGEFSDVYEHCCRAIDRSLKVGEHGLPLFGTGDWNDGMNRVGREGRGESVWMGFFLVMVLDGFGPHCANRNDQERVERYATHRRKLEHALNEGGWDGRWYRRGYYDDGSPLGSHQNAECRIDALAQAWAVLSGVAPRERAAQALAALEDHLVLEDPGLIKLLTPPFADTPHDPGYIKGYVAGVRENGGQYTHAALWVVRALAKARRRDKAAHFLDLLNPILHATTPEQVAVYQAEPYVVAADVYGAEPHVGRGGWTWYTGSSGWMHRAAVESVLGLRLLGGKTLVLEPCIPDHWPSYTMTWNVPDSQTTYRITVSNPDRCSAAVVRATLDDAPVVCTKHAVQIPLIRDGQTHQLDVTLGAPSTEESV